MEHTGTNDLPLLSVVVPAHNEARNLAATVREVAGALDDARIPFEIVVVNDHSKDDTAGVAGKLAAADPRVRPVENTGEAGYGHAVRRGLEEFRGQAVVIVMADRSDNPRDIVVFYGHFLRGYECVFGTRFCRQAHVSNYPWHKLVLNRLGNFFIQSLFLIPYNDVTNAFKCYSRKAIEGMAPLISCHFNLTVEMPLKAIVRGYTWKVVPTDWKGRTYGISKWNIKEMGSRYLFIILYLWLEKTLIRKDYMHSAPKSVKKEDGKVDANR